MGQLGCGASLQGGSHGKGHIGGHIVKPPLPHVPASSTAGFPGVAGN